jgi:hypothetical protein
MNSTFGFDVPDPPALPAEGVLDVGVLERDDELHPAASTASTTTTARAQHAFTESRPQDIAERSRTPRT